MQQPLSLSLSLYYFPLHPTQEHPINHPSTKQAQISNPSLIPHTPFSLHHPCFFQNLLQIHHLHQSPPCPSLPTAFATLPISLPSYGSATTSTSSTMSVSPPPTTTPLSILLVYCFNPSDYGKSASNFNKTGPYRVAFLIDFVFDLYRNL